MLLLRSDLLSVQEYVKKEKDGESDRRVCAGTKFLGSLPTCRLTHHKELRNYVPTAISL